MASGSSENWYMPVLKTKRAEKYALTRIDKRFHQRIRPLFEIIARNPEKVNSVTEHLKSVFKNLAVCAKPYGRCFLDAREIAPDGEEAANEAFSLAVDYLLKFTPVTGVTRAADVPAVMRFGTEGIALRVTRSEFESGDLMRDVRNFVSRHALNYEGIDLIVDMESVDEMIDDGVMACAEAFLAELPELKRWRTLTISGSAFPLSTGQRNSQKLVERVEWKAWRNMRELLPRRSNFSDCVVQHPRGVEGFDHKKMQVSAVIRYTLDEEWLLIKGESLNRAKGWEQFQNLSTHLVHGHLRKHFEGSSHCRGCQGIHAAAAGAENYASPEAWRRIGTIHHISTVMNALSSLPEP